MANENDNPHLFPSDRIAQLQREINTNKEFGFKGIMDANDEALRQQDVSGLQQRQTVESPVAEQQPPAQPAPEQIAEILEPMNNSFQQVREQLGGFRQDLDSLRTDLGQFRPAIPAQTEPAAPVDPVQARLDVLSTRQRQLASDNLYNRSLNVMHQVAAEHPEAKLVERDLQDLWKQMDVSNKVDTNGELLFEKADWKKHWETIAQSREAPLYNKKYKELQAEIDRLKANQPNALEQLSAVPASKRGSLVLPSQMDSMNPDGTDNRVYNAANARMSKGQFRGFNRQLVDEQNRLALTGT